MKILLALLLLFAVVQIVSACGRRKKCRKGQCPPPRPPPPPPLPLSLLAPIPGDGAFPVGPGPEGPAALFPSLGLVDPGLAARPGVSFKESISEQGFLDSANVISELLGPFKIESILSLSGGDSALYNPRDLSCSFDVPCCWHNIAGGDDDLQWAVLTEQPDTTKAIEQFQVDTLPEAPFAITGARKSHAFVYSFLVSCPILCQLEEGTLNFQHWTSEGVVLDVCTLPLGSRNFTFCQTISGRKEVDVKISVPPQKDPFVLVIVGSEFTSKSGGVAAVDNLQYFARLCQPDQLEPEQNVETIYDSKYDEVCSALNCDFQSEDTEKLCKYKDSDLPGAFPFFQSRHRTGNYAAGVPFSNVREFYLAAKVKPRSAAAVTSVTFSIPEDIRIDFEFFEAADDVSLRVCFDLKTDCKEVSSKPVIANDRRWRKGSYDLPRGEDRALYFVAENTGHNHAAVGISEIRISDQFGTKINCKRPRDHDSNYYDNFSQDLKVVESHVEEEYYDFENNFEELT